MGKTKIQVISNVSQEEKTSLDRYKEKQKRKKQESLKKAKGVRVPGLKGGERVVAVGGEIEADTETPLRKSSEGQAGQKDFAPKVSKAKVSRVGQPRVRGKKYRMAKAKIDSGKNYPVAEAVKLTCETSIAKFGGNLEFHAVVKKGKVDVEAILPYSTGQKKRVEVADENTIKNLKMGKINFDVLIATAQMMPKLVPFAKVLGPKGLMPNPKNGTLANDTKKAAEKFSGNTLKIKTEKKAPLVHLVVGKIKQPEQELVANLQAVIEAIGPKNIKKALVLASMGPAVRLEISDSDKRMKLLSNSFSNLVSNI